MAGFTILFLYLSFRQKLTYFNKKNKMATIFCIFFWNFFLYYKVYYTFELHMINSELLDLKKNAKWGGL